MTGLRRKALAWTAVAMIALAAEQAFAQPGPPFGRGRGGRGQAGDPQFVLDRDVFHFLLASHDQIRRQVTPRADGVETLTESDNPEIAAKIQEHVAAMYRRVEEVRPIHMRDPLFAEVFRHADRIELKFEKTNQGVKVVETSKDPYVVKLIRAHAQVVNGFVKNGFTEAQKNHTVPGDATVAAKPAEEPATAAAGGCGKCATCPNAVAGSPGCKACPKTAAKPGCQQCPKAVTCPATQAGENASGGCKTCPFSNQCPAAAAGSAPTADGDSPPPPNQDAKKR